MKTQDIKQYSSALALMATLALCSTAGAKELDFNYVEGNYVDTDVDYSQSFSEGGDSISLETDSGSGFQVGAAWELWENWHVFAEYAQASQDLELGAVFDGEAFNGTGDFDVVRYRIGIGYGFEISDAMLAYARVSFDSIEFQDFEIDGEDLGDIDDDGLGAELGMLWAITPQLHLQGQLRYTSVGELDDGEGSSFDSDILYGVSGRWYFSDTFALQAGYEAGQISTWHAGVRFAF